MELLGSALLAILLFAVFILPIGAFASSLVRCVLGCSGEEEKSPEHEPKGSQPQF